MKKMKKFLNAVLFMFFVSLCLCPQTTSAETRDVATRKAYARFLSQKSIFWVDDYFPLKECEFAIIDIDNDHVPELLIENSMGGGYRGCEALYHYKNGKVEEFYHFGNAHGLDGYYPNAKVFLDTGGRMGAGYDLYSTYQNYNDKEILLRSFEEKIEHGQFVGYNNYYYSKLENGASKKISKNEFKIKRDKLLRNSVKKKPIMRKNTSANRKRYILPKESSVYTKLNKSKLTLYMNKTKTYQLKATVKGADKKITWHSSNSSIVTVSPKGKLTAKKPGIVTITAKANGKSAFCKVTVKKK